MSRKLEIELELRIVRKCVEDAIAQGYHVSLNDGEETVVHKSTDVEKIMGAAFSTDEDYLVFYKDTGKLAGAAAHPLHEGKPQNFMDKIGWAHFIYGNVQDVLSDYSANAQTESIVRGATELAEQYNDQ